MTRLRNKFLNPVPSFQLLFFIFYNFNNMKNLHITGLALIISLLFFSCNDKGGGSGQKSTQLVSARSLGLAYLEEFKLNEAEKEFQKFIRLSPKDKFGYANLGLTYLRMGKYPEAKIQLAKAIGIDKNDADIRLILATVYQMNDERPLAISELKDALSFAPDHLKVLYDLSELYSNEQDTASLREREKYLRLLIQKAPGNLVPRLALIEMLIRKGSGEEAINELEDIHRQFPEPPKEATGYFDKSLSLLRKGDRENAVIQYTIFYNYLKVTSPFQAGIMDLKGPGGSLIGFPLITFDQQASTVTPEKRPLGEMMKFSDATKLAGLGLPDGSPAPAGYITHAEPADYDGDGDIDLYVGSYDPATSQYRHYLFNNEMGKYRDVTAEAGLRHQGKEYGAIFGDYDNDGFLDLYILREGGDLLYRNTGKGTFEDVTAASKAGSRTGGKKALFADIDHDGDLDIFEVTSGANLVFRNNADGTFTEDAEKMGLAGKGSGSSDVVFGDFDDDGDLDLFVTSEKDGNTLYTNLREGRFRDFTADAELTENPGSAAAAAADYDNDGFLDIFTASSAGGKSILYHNKRDGTFEKVTISPELVRGLDASKPLAAEFLDFDNDGLSDIATAGEPSADGGRGLYLFHNEGSGKFSDASFLLPEEVRSGRELSVFDYNEDGDLDLVVSGLNDGISLLRNDGGNTNHFIKMKLVGLRAGSAKNNHFGIGAKVEMRAGDLYQTKVVTQPEVQFGIGDHKKVDVIRITWTNGVPQNIFYPGADQSLIEAQMLKGSCPFLYTWDGDKYTFSKDIIWRSALGMPTGIMGGETAYAFPDASDDYISVPGETLKPSDGEYRIQVTSELWETIYIDELQLVTVDHPDSVDIFVAEQFTPPPFPGLRIYTVNRKYPPVSAADGDGNNVLPLISAKDDRYLADFNPGRYQGITDVHDLVLDPGNQVSGKNFFMFMTGWIFPTDASINKAVSQASDITVVTPVIQVVGKKGEWITINDRLGFPMGKDKTVICDLSGKFPTPDHRIRIRTNMEIYWDRIFFSDCNPKSPMVTRVLDPASADLHYRGFSRMYRKGGPEGPHWFDYSDVTREPRWRDLKGNYTRYGDVLSLLTGSDNKYIISNAGDETSVKFSMKTLPPVPNGWKRDFLIHSVGWVKDGDLNTATGNSVLPLPFHGMKSFPPGKADVYPGSPELERYNREYNTRVVTNEDFLNAVRVNSKLVHK